MNHTSLHDVFPPTDQWSATAPAQRLKRPPWLVVTQLFFALGWLRAVGEKAISIDWWTGETISVFAAEHAAATLPWFQPIVDAAVAFAPLAALVVLVAELAIGLGLLTNRGLALVLPVAIGLNLAFIAAGAVNPSAFYLIGQGAVVLWMAERWPPTPGLSKALQLTIAVATIRRSCSRCLLC